jgi:salicylate hydroxylase
MVPHLGQGTAQAIEDGFTLAVLLEGVKGKDVPDRLRTYERLGIERTRRIQAVARDAGRLYRAQYENASEQDLLMREWMSTLGWIRGHDTEKVPRKPFDW